jgi:hypothetical protein
MHLLRFTLSVGALLGACACSQASDLIDQLAQRLARLQTEALEKNADRVFPSGLYEPIFLPSNSIPEEVAKAALKRDDWFASTNCSVVATRVVTIFCDSERFAGGNTNFVAVLLRTSLGDRVVLLQFIADNINRKPRFDHWWSRVYDPRRLLNHSAGLDAATALCSHVARQRRCASERGRWPSVFQI